TTRAARWRGNPEREAAVPPGVLMGRRPFNARANLEKLPLVGASSGCGVSLNADCQISTAIPADFCLDLNHLGAEGTLLHRFGPRTLPTDVPPQYGQIRLVAFRLD